MNGMCGIEPQVGSPFQGFGVVLVPVPRALPLIYPPLAEQRRIVATVDQLMALMDALDTQSAASRASAAKLLDALVAELTSC